MIRGLDLESHDEIINIGLGSGITIIDLANQIKNLVGYTGELKLDESKTLIVFVLVLLEPVKSAEPPIKLLM